MIGPGHPPPFRLRRAQRVRVVFLLALVISASAFGQPTLEDIRREATGGQAIRAKGIDANGRLFEWGGGPVTPPRDEISHEQRREIQSAIDENRARLVSEGKLSRTPTKTLTGFGWPLRAAAGRTDPDYHGIANFVDEDPAYPSKVRDYMCGARSYDTAGGYNHQGTDIFTWPWGWKKMDDEDVVIVAGAAGTIIKKDDGNADRSCALGNLPANAVFVQHADGSIAWYFHMKNGSTTVKSVGDTVAAGEYLGVVGSSGSSTGPHLHLELYDAGSNLVDPWLGPCNAMSKQVTFAQQRAYRDTGLNAMTIGTAAAVLPACPTTETTFATDYIVPGTNAYFTIYLRDQVPGSTASMRVLRPDGSVFTGPWVTGDGTYDASYWYWYFTNFPNVPGTWTLEATLAGKTYTKTFQVADAPAYGPPAALAVLAGSAQSTNRGSAFASPLRLRVTDAQDRPVKGAKVSFVVPGAGATAILESKTALTDATGVASVTAVANNALGSYDVTATVSGLAGTATIPLQNVLGDNARTLIASYYETILGRPADSTGLDFWTSEASRVVGLGADVREVFFALSMAFFSSPEYVTRGTSDTQYVTDLYRTFFNRVPDAAGLSYWQGELDAVKSRSALLYSFLFSTEFSNQMTALFGGGSVRPEVNMTIDLYRGTLGRLPDSAGFTYWLGQIRNAQCLGAAQVSAAVANLAGLFFNSGEYLARARTDRDFVGDVYNAYMRRGPGGDSGGFNYWVGQVATLGRDGVRAQFIPSPEFQNRVSAVIAAGCFPN